MRRLTLRRETLAELTSDELSAVVAGVTTTGYYLTIPVGACLAELTTG